MRGVDNDVGSRRMIIFRKVSLQIRILLDYFEELLVLL
jgi:hypothetical protein